MPFFDPIREYARSVVAAGKRLIDQVLIPSAHIPEGRAAKGIPDQDWHAMSARDVLAQLESSEDGLSDGESATRLTNYGPNRLPEQRRRTAVERLLSQFNNLLIYILLGAVVVTGSIGHWIDAFVIAGVVVINAAIGFFQEGRAEKAIDAIRSLLSEQTIVLRKGKRKTLNTAVLVPGDIVFLEAGDRVPADIRLLRARNLMAQEAPLTGESVPVEKHTSAVPIHAGIGDRTSMVFTGTIIARGQGRGVVVATGAATELGRISGLLDQITQLQTPLLRQMERFGQTLAIIILITAALTFAIGVLIYAHSASDMFLAAIGLIVAAIPEGLPAIMTITLALGVERMAGRNALIRRLPAIETLGSVTVICSDKTGTLTQNEMTVRSVATSEQLIEVIGIGLDPIGEFLFEGKTIDPENHPLLRQLTLGAVLCSDATIETEGDGWIVNGDPMEGALLVAGAKAGFNAEDQRRAFPRTDEIPFDAAHRFMATLHHDHEGNGYIYVKGAPEQILSMCVTQRTMHGDEPLDSAYWQTRITEMAGQGERVLALAVKQCEPGKTQLTFGDVETGLTLLGAFGLIDPPREEAIEAIERCRSAGIVVKMITGDHVATATAIAEKLGLRTEYGAISGQDLDNMSNEDLARRIEEVDIFARTSPEHKLRLVETLQRAGHVVAMTGDGVNDAPALKRADVGVAMGKKGTAAAREASEMVLANDNFASISAAVEEGRVVYDNLKKTILFILPTNGGEALLIMAAVLLNWTLPLTPVQILWVNMVTAVTLGLALAFEAPESDVMKRPPRSSSEPILSRFLAWRIALVSLIILIGVFGIFSWLRSGGASIELARTAAVNTLVMFEIFYLFSVRRLFSSAFSDILKPAARPAWIAVTLVFIMQLAFTYVPIMNSVFASAPISFNTWMALTAVASSVLVVMEAERWLMLKLAERVSGNQDSQQSNISVSSELK